jgi:hypothetical protein
MKTNAIIIWIVMLCMTLVCTAQQAPKLPENVQFIMVTQPVKWDDGMACEVGEIEVVLEFTRTAYVIWNENGKRYEVNRTHAKKVTSDEAAVRLLVKRQQLYARQNQMLAAIAPLLQNQQNQQNQNGNQNLKELQEMREALALIQQMQNLVNGGAGGNLPLPNLPAGGAAGGGHWIKSVIERGQTIQLENGSLWQINPLNKVDAILWMSMEQITVVESGNALYPYKLVNTSSKSAAEAKLISR